MDPSNDCTMDLTGSVIERFLDAVQQHPCVYDTKRLDYRDADRKNNAWEIIREHSGLSTVADCLRLWKRLRDRYTRELKAIEQSKRSGSGYVSRRTWEFAETMSFYRDCGRLRKTTCSVLEAPSTSAGDVGETAESLLESMQNTLPSPLTEECLLGAPPELPSPATPATPPPPLAASPTMVADRYQPASKQKKGGKKTDSFEEQLLGKLDSKMSENEAFGFSIGMTLDKMPRKIALKCKASIMQLISDLYEQYEEID